MGKKETMLGKVIRFIFLINLMIYSVKLNVSASSVEIPFPSQIPESIEDSENIETLQFVAAEVVLKPGKTFQSDCFQYVVSTRNESKKTGTVMLSGMTSAKTEVSIPETEIGPDGYIYTVTQIGEKCFYGNTKLVSIYIPSTIRNIRSCAFSGCKSLKKIELDKNNLYYKTKGNALYSKDGSTLIALLCTGISYTPPSTVTSIASGAFVYCGDLKAIAIPKTVKKMGMIFDNSCPNLKTITFKGSIPPTIEKTLKVKDGRTTQLLCNLDIYHLGLQIFVPKGSETSYQKQLKEIFWSSKSLPLVPYKK